MTDTKHDIDALVPSDTAQFDSISDQQPADEELAKAQKDLIFQLNRFQKLVNAMLATPNVSLAMTGETYIQTSLARAELVVMSKLIEEKLGVSPAEYLSAVAEQLKAALAFKEIEYKIIITGDGVINVK